MKKAVGLVLMIVVVVALVIVACGEAEETTTTTTTEQTTTTAPATTTTTENPVIGTYTGAYTLEKPRMPGEFAVEFEVREDRSVVGRGELYDGTEFEAEGALDSDNFFTAEGELEAAGMTVTFSGSFSLEDETVSGEGTWDVGDGKYSGTWTATKDE